MLSDLGGLFGIIIIFLAFFMMPYNQYKYELVMARGAFNFTEEGRKIKAEDFNFFKYLKYTLYDWINALGCCHLKW